MTAGTSTSGMKERIAPRTYAPANQPYIVKNIKQTNIHLKPLEIVLSAYNK
jgi:hypothetical protein